MQYRVDMAPEEDNLFIKKMLLRDVKDKLPKYIFDGTMLWATEQLDANPLKLYTVRRGDQVLFFFYYSPSLPITS